MKKHKGPKHSPDDVSTPRLKKRKTDSSGSDRRPPAQAARNVVPVVNTASGPPFPQDSYVLIREQGPGWSGQVKTVKETAAGYSYKLSLPKWSRDHLGRAVFKHHELEADPGHGADNAEIIHSEKRQRRAPESGEGGEVPEVRSSIAPLIEKHPFLFARMTRREGDLNWKDFQSSAAHENVSLTDPPNKDSNPMVATGRDTYSMLLHQGSLAGITRPAALLEKGVDKDELPISTDEEGFSELAESLMVKQLNFVYRESTLPKGKAQRNEAIGRDGLIETKLKHKDPHAEEKVVDGAAFQALLDRLIAQIQEALKLGDDGKETVPIDGDGNPLFPDGNIPPLDIEEVDMLPHGVDDIRPTESAREGMNALLGAIGADIWEEVAGEGDLVGKTRQLIALLGVDPIDTVTVAINRSSCGRCTNELVNQIAAFWERCDKEFTPEITQLIRALGMVRFESSVAGRYSQTHDHHLRKLYKAGWHLRVHPKYEFDEGGPRPIYDDNLRALAQTIAGIQDAERLRDSPTIKDGDQEYDAGNARGAGNCFYESLRMLDASLPGVEEMRGHLADAYGADGSDRAGIVRRMGEWATLDDVSRTATLHGRKIVIHAYSWNDVASEKLRVEYGPEASPERPALHLLFRYTPEDGPAGELGNVIGHFDPLTPRVPVPSRPVDA